MINFGDLQVQKEKSTIPTIVIDARDITDTIPKIDFQKDVLKKGPKRTKAELRIIEPGYKIGIGEFHQVAQYCDECENVTLHCHKPEAKKLICTNCKTITIHK